MKLFGFTIGSAALAAVAQGANIYDLAADVAALSTLKTAVDLAGLKGALSTTPNLTVFAPTNTQFAALGDALGHLVVNSTYSNELLSKVLLTHVVGSVIKSGDLPKTKTTVNTLGEALEVTLTKIVAGQSEANVNTATPGATFDILADNGVVHLIDNVLLPKALPLKTIAETAVSAQFNSLVAALTAADYVDLVSKPTNGQALTVFAPTDAAFASLLSALKTDLPTLASNKPLLQAVLKVHVASGGDVVRAAELGDKFVKTLGGVIDLNTQGKFADTDIEALNGMVHVVNQVILPTILSFASSIEAYSTLSSLVELAGLRGALSNPASDLTVFAPSNTAFAALPAKVVAHLTAKNDYSKGLLGDVLKYHVLPKGLKSNQLGSSQATLLEGSVLTFAAGKINDASVISTVDLDFANSFFSGGIVHLIDSVLVPAGFPTLTITDAVLATESLSTLKAAVVAAGLADLFENPTTNAWTVFAPTNAAFKEIQSTVDAALKDVNLLTTILKAHVVATPLFAKDLPNEIVTVGGEKIQKTAVKASSADLKFLNGVVHIVDKVIIPPSLQTTSAPTAPPSENDNTALIIGAAVAGVLALGGFAYCAMSGKEDKVGSSQSMVARDLESQRK